MALVVAQYADRGKPQDLRQVYSEHAIAVQVLPAGAATHHYRKHRTQIATNKIKV